MYLDSYSLYFDSCSLCFDAKRRYEVMTFSRPDHPLSAITYPLVRFYQRRYGNDSALAMAKAVAVRD